jgi:hypothetical protein
MANASSSLVSVAQRAAAALNALRSAAGRSFSRAASANSLAPISRMSGCRPRPRSSLRCVIHVATSSPNASKRNRQMPSSRERCRRSSGRSRRRAQTAGATTPLRRGEEPHVHADEVVPLAEGGDGERNGFAGEGGWPKQRVRHGRVRQCHRDPSRPRVGDAAPDGDRADRNLCSAAQRRRARRNGRAERVVEATSRTYRRTPNGHTTASGSRHCIRNR